MSPREDLESSRPKISKKCKAKAIVDIPIEDMPEEDAPDSPPRRGASATKEEENFPHYVWPRRVDAKEVKLSKKVRTSLVTP